MFEQQVVGTAGNAEDAAAREAAVAASAREPPPREQLIEEQNNTPTPTSSSSIDLAKFEDCSSLSSRFVLDFGANPADCNGNNSEKHNKESDKLLAAANDEPLSVAPNNKRPLEMLNSFGKRLLSRSVDQMHLDSSQQVSSTPRLEFPGGQVRSEKGLSCKQDNLARSISQSMLALDEENGNRVGHFEVVWRNLSFSYKQSSYPKLASNLISKNESDDQDDASQVLRELSGRFSSNQLVAIIGPSGCGKTTLLHFLAGNNSHESDRLRITGLDKPKVALIGQDDCLLPGLTARETLVYASRLQNPTPNFDHKQHVAPILNQLGLAECADRNVAKLSGGQAKRVTIAQELLYPTNLLVLDEVTSGLDASTSHSIVRLLKELVSDLTYPMSIVMSIHQPSARLFAIFDKVYVMSEGSCLYEGTCNVGQINTTLGRFGLECPKYHNVADYLIELACENLASSGASSKQPGNDVVAIKHQMVQYQRKRNELLEATSGVGPAAAAAGVANGNGAAKREPVPPGYFGDEQRIPMLPLETRAATSRSLYEAIEFARNSRERPFWGLFWVHLRRSMLRIRRSYILTYLQLVTYVLLGLQLATFYGPQIGSLSGCPRLPSSLMSHVLSAQTVDENNNVSDSAEDELTHEMRRIQENMNFLLVTVMTATFAALEITVITFPLEAKTVKREWRNGWYKVSSYFMGRTLADLPFQVVFVSIFSALVYTLTGQLGGLASWRFASFFGLLLMTALVAQSFGFIFGALFMDNLPAAVFTAPLTIFPTLLFSGFFSRVSQIPTVYKPLTFLSHFRYVFDALLVTLYGHKRCDCDQQALTGYHNSLQNQTATMKEMFGYMFGSSDCATTPAPEIVTPEAAAASSLAPLVASEDAAAIMAANASVANAVQSYVAEMAAATTAAPQRHAPLSNALETALVEGAFGLLNGTSPSDDTSNQTDSFMDTLAERFSRRLTQTLNKQANFGHQMPTNCTKFNSYLINEFDLSDSDLISGLATLLFVVLLTRVLSNYILNMTIETRNRSQ